MGKWLGKYKQKNSLGSGGKGTDTADTGQPANTKYRQIAEALRSGKLVILNAPGIGRVGIAKDSMAAVKGDDDNTPVFTLAEIRGIKDREEAAEIYRQKLTPDWVRETGNYKLARND